MKNWMLQCKAILHGKKGESLVESVLSILLFAILMLGVGTMLSTSMQMTKTSNQEADRMQQDVNTVTLEQGSVITGTPKMKLTISGGTGVSHDITILEENGILAFIPKE